MSHPMQATTMSHRHVVNLTSPRLTCSGWQKRLVKNDISYPRVCECVGILACRLFRKEGAVKLLQIEPRNDASRCHTPDYNTSKPNLI